MECGEPWVKGKTTCYCTVMYALFRTRIEVLKYSHKKSSVSFHVFFPNFVQSKRPLPSSINPHFQKEAKSTTLLVKMSFICMRMKNHFHIKG